jgi:hypothetical protein
VTAQTQRRAGIVPSNKHIRALAIVAAISVLLSVAIATVAPSLAVFTAQPEDQAIFGSKALFPGERVTPAFQVGDSSSGIEIDRSSSFAFSSDGRTTTTSPWSNAFAADRYLEFDFNDSLASGVAISAASFDVRLSSSGAGEACYYFELRRISTGAILGTHGSPGSPVGCVTGTTLTSFSTPLSTVATTTVANDLRVRLFGMESANAAMVIDLSTVGGSTAHQAFTMYPVMFSDAADTTPEVVAWGLDLP